MGSKQLKSAVSVLAPFLLAFIGIWMLFQMFTIMNIDPKPVLTIIVALSPIWLPIAIFHITFEQWIWSVGAMFQYNQGRTTLRIKLPQEVFKSPEAMESVLTQIHNVNSRDNLMQTYLDGKHPLVTSLELVSIGGDVRFYANVPTAKVKNALEAQLYAQYPGVEVTEEEIDYTAEMKYDPEKWDMISFHMGKKKDEVYPIKTYVDYGMDRLPKEEEKFDPISPMLEHLSQTKPYERIWVQFLCTPHVALGLKEGELKTIPTWEAHAADVVDKLMGRDKGKAGPDDSDTRPVLTISERETIASIERNVSKYAYSVGIRAIYFAENGKFSGNMISPLVRSFAQNDIMGRNQIGVRWRTDFNYHFFQDITGNRVKLAKKRELEYYKARYYIHDDKKGRADEEKVFSVEELATLWHLPGSTVVTPGVSRVENTRREAPSNLPTGNF
jgi:hypothetical protein